MFPVMIRCIVNHHKPDACVVWLTQCYLQVSDFVIGETSQDQFADL